MRPENGPPSSDRGFKGSRTSVFLGHFHVGSVGFSYHPNILVGRPPHHLGRCAYSDRAWRDGSALENHCADTNDRVSADFCSIENDCSGSDEAFVADSASMNNRAMSDRNPITNHSSIFGRAVNDNIILQAAVYSYPNLAVVTAENGPRPDAGASTNHNVAYDARIGRDNGRRVDFGFLRPELVERHSTHRTTANSFLPFCSGALGTLGLRRGRLRVRIGGWRF